MKIKGGYYETIVVLHVDGGFSDVSSRSIRPSGN